VANPATQRWAHLPPLPRFWGLFCHGAHLVFDPTESPHYEVFLVPENLFREDPDMERREQMTDEEWPPSTWVLCVFSSRTGKWEERAFVREGEAAGMASDKALQRHDERDSWPICSAYWNGVLFAQCNGGFTVMRISLSNNKHKVIKMPTGIGELEKVYLGRSKEELCCATINREKLRVWILDDSCGMMGWRLKHHIDIEYTISHVMWFIENEGPWNLQDISNNEDNGLQNLQDVNNNEDVNNNAPVKSKVEWDSDNDNIIDLESDDEVSFMGCNTVLGFHPYKDVIFLNFALERAVAYHLNTSVVQDLGKVRPDYYCGYAAELLSSFLYTPCLMAEFPEEG